MNVYYDAVSVPLRTPRSFAHWDIVVLVNSSVNFLLYCTMSRLHYLRRYQVTQFKVVGRGKVVDERRESTGSLRGECCVNRRRPLANGIKPGREHWRSIVGTAAPTSSSSRCLCGGERESERLAGKNISEMTSLLCRLKPQFSPSVCTMSRQFRGTFWDLFVAPLRCRCLADKDDDRRATDAPCAQRLTTVIPARPIQSRQPTDV